MALPAIAAAAGALALRELAKEGGGAAGRGLVGAAGRGFCNAHANNPGIIGSLGSIATDFANGACAPYYDEYGIIPPIVGLPEFKGGQCVGIEYYVEFKWQNVSAVSTSGSFLYGPILGTTTAPQSENYSYVGVRGHDVQGNERVYFGGGTRNDLVDTLRITKIERVDGGTDNCGDPPPPPSVPSPNAPPVNYGEPFDGEDSSGRNAPITIFPPVFSPDGGLSIPIDIDGNPADLGNPPPPGGGKPEDDAPVEPGDAREPAPEDGGKVCFNSIAGKELVGVSWNITVPEAFGEIPNSLIPVYPRVIGNIRLLLGACDTVSGIVEDQVQIRTAKGSLFRSVGGTQVSGAIINTLPGVEVSLTPLYVSVEEEE